MKTVKVQGGLGNQLFCLALAHSIAVLSGEAVALDLAAYQGDRYGHRFSLGDLAARLGLALVSRPVLGARATTALLRAFAPRGYVSEGAAPSDEAGLRALAARGRYFNGYWQNEAFIAAPDDLRGRIRGFLLEMGGETPRGDVVIHYRTYREEIRADRRGVPDPAYFRRALAAAEAAGGPVETVLVVSDDPALALERMGDIGRPLVPAPAASPWADMAVLLRARRLILTNSSFSWWGGFCGEARAISYPSRGRLFHYPAPAAAFSCL